MIRCPIVNKDIEIGECVLIVDISEGCVKETLLPGDVKKVNKWKEICNRCEYHNN
ncbi:MAG: hypothetical protein MR510_03435 [Clostridium sp.]|nr:hypothetical protein [Clostridium sp.]